MGWRQRTDKSIEARIAAERCPLGIVQEVAIAKISRHLQQFLDEIDRAIGVAGPGVNYGQSLQDERAIIGIASDRHEIDGMLRLVQRESLVTETGIRLREDGERASVLRFDFEACFENRSRLRESCAGCWLIAFCMRNLGLIPGAREIEAEIDSLKILAR